MQFPTRVGHRTKEILGYGHSWDRTDYFFDDIEGHLGPAEWMTWTLVSQKTMLLPFKTGAAEGQRTDEIFDVKRWPHWNPNVSWQPRPVYMLEVRPKKADNPYGRILMLVDAETYTVRYKEIFDKHGRLWKVILNGEQAPRNPGASPLLPGFGLALDLREKRATLITFRKVAWNTGLTPEEFSVSRMRRAYRGE